jgi:SAM-dependent methyltransferase
MSRTPVCICSVSKDVRRIGGPSFPGRHLYQCKGCGTVQLFPWPATGEAMQALYQNAAYLSKIQEQEYFGYFKVFDDYIQKQLGLPKDMAVLDFGAGRCYYQKFFLQMGYRQAHSFEINRNVAQHAKRLLGLQDVFTDISELPLAHYDLVVSSQVFEHLENPLKTLEIDILPRVREGGVICFAIPNWDSWNRPVLRRRWLGYSPEDHLWFFNKASISRLLKGLPAVEVVDICVRSAVGKPYDGFRPNGLVKRLYYNSLWRVFELCGRGDQLIVTVRKVGARSTESRAA